MWVCIGVFPDAVVLTVIMVHHMIICPRMRAFKLASEEVADKSEGVRRWLCIGAVLRCEEMERNNR
jgi:hypothetical protein